MRGPIDKRAPRSSVRREALRIARTRYPFGKALGRIEYFETQRELPKSGEKDGLVATAAAPVPRVRKTAPKAGTLKARALKARRATPPSPYAKAGTVKARMAPGFAASQQLAVWRPLGPSVIPKGQTYGTGGNNKPPVSGRCSGLVISPTNPQHLVLCSGGGGLWRTIDLGQTWQPLTDDQPTLSMGAIAAAPGSPNIVYAGTGEGDNLSQQGVGLLRSADGGQTWQHVPSTELAGSGIYDLAVDPGNALHVWAGTTEKLIESTNGGATWRVVQPVTTWDVSINPANPQEIFAATAAGLIRSANGGSSWAVVALPGVTAAARFERLEVCHAPSNPAIVYVAGVFNGRGALWRRATAGGSFSVEATPALKSDSDIAQAWYDWCFAVSPVNPNLVYWGAVELYRGTRTAAGWQWQNIASRSSGDSIHPDQHHLTFDPTDPNVLYVCNDGGLFRSPNGGTNWQSLNRGLNITEFEFLSHLESQDEWLIGGTQDNGTLGNATNTTWNQIALGDGGDCGTDDAQGLCYHSYYGMWIERAPALGPSAFRWKDVSPPFDDDYDALFYPPMDVRGKVVAKGGVTLFVSDNNGDNWTEVDLGGGGKASVISITAANTIFVGTVDGALMRVQRAPGGWAKATITRLTSPRHGYLSDIVVPGQPTRTIWVSSSAFGGGHVFRSLNGGITWTDKTGNLPDIPVNAIVVDPRETQRVFAATDHGVYQTQNSGGTWKDFSNGLPNVVVGDLILHERRRLLRAGTRNRGAWEVTI